MKRKISQIEINKNIITNHEVLYLRVNKLWLYFLVTQFALLLFMFWVLVKFGMIIL